MPTTLALNLSPTAARDIEDQRLWLIAEASNGKAREA